MKTGSAFFAIGFFIFAFVLILPLGAGAQEASDASGVVVATVNIYNAKIVAQDGRDLTVSFDLYNRKGVQPQVRYAIQLQKVSGNARYAIAQKVYDETLTLREDQTVGRTVDFVVPSYIVGEYDVVVLAMNEQSLPFGINIAGTISFASGEQFVEIAAETCALTIGEAAEKYTIIQGVDVDADETLTLRCSASSNFDRSISVTPVFTRHYRSSLGEKLDVVPLVREPISFSAGQKKDIALRIPLTKEPQAYDTIVSFVDENGDLVSNDIAVHYVIRGKSATAQSVLFDKDSYKVGERASIQIFWSAAADAFGESRVEGTDVGAVQMRVDILDASGAACAAPYEKNVTRKDSIILADVAIEKDCVNPSAKISITDSEGETLTRATFTVNPEKKKAADRVMESVGMRKSTSFIVIAIITIVALGAILMTIIRRRGSNGGQGPKGGMYGMFFLFLFAGAMALPQSSSADTFTVGDWSCIGNRTYSVNLNKGTYSPGESIVAYGWGIDPACGNTSIVMGLRGHANGGTGYLINCTWSGACGNRAANTVVTLYGSAIIGSAQSAAGSYQASFDGYAGFGPRWKCATARWVDDAYRLPYSVVAPVPSITLSASPNPIDYNTASTLTWTVSNATSCTASNGWSGTKSASGGTESTGNLTATTTYTLSCTGTGGTASSSVIVTVNPQPQPPTVSLTASPDQIILSSGQSLPQNTTLSWNSTNADSCIAFGGAWAGLKATSGTESVPVSANPTTFTIQCSNVTGPASDSVTVSSGCYARSCQSNSCQQAFQSTSSYNCTNSCTSNADCSTGGGFREVEP